MSSPVLGAASVEVGADLGKFEPQVKKSVDQAFSNTVTGVTKAGTRVGRAFVNTVGKTIKGGATAAAAGFSAIMGAALVKGFGRLRTIDEATQKLYGLGNSGKTVSKIMSNALAAVKGTAFGMDEAATTAGSVVASGVKPGKQLQKVLTTVADTATIAGTSMSDMGTIFASVAARNKLQGDDMLQLLSRGVPVLSFLAKHYHVTTEAASEMVSKGKVDFKDFAAAMAENIGGAAQKSGKTFSGAWANMWASVSRIGANLMSGFFPELAPTLTAITKAMGGAEDQAKKFGKAIGDRVAPMMKRLSDFLSGSGPASIFGALKSAPSIIGPAAAAFGALGASGLAPLVRMVPGLGGLAGTLGRLGGPIGIVTTAVLGLIAASPELRGAFLGALTSVSGALQDLAPVIGSLASKAVPLLAGALSGVAKVLTVVLGWVADSPKTFLALAAAFGVVVAAINVYNTVTRVMAAVSAAQKAVTLGLTAATYGQQGALLVAGNAMKIYKARLIAGAIAEKAVAVATKAWAATQWLINAALTANPIGLVIAGVAALIAGIVLLWRRSETFRSIVLAVWGAIKAGAGAVVDWFMGSVVPFFTTTLPAAFTAAKAGIIGAWDAVTSFISTAYHTVVDPVVTALTTAWGAVVVAFQAVGKAFMVVWNGWISPVLDLFTAIVKWAIGVVVKPYILAAQLAWKALGVAFQWTMSHVISPTIDMFVSGWRLAKKAFAVVVGAVQAAWKKTASFLTAVWNKSVAVVAGWLGSVFRANQVVFGKAMSAVRSAWDTMSRALRKVWDATLGPVAAWLGSKFTAAGRVFSTAMSRVRSHWQSAASYLKSVWNKTISVVLSALSKAVGKVKDAFATAASGIRTAWNKIKGYAKAPVRFVIETVLNNGLIAGFNKLADLFGTKHMSRIPLPRGFATGTPAAPPGLAWTGERGPELVQFKGGERVFTAQQSARMAAAYRNSAVPGYAGGGIVSAIASKAKSFFGGITHPVNWVKDKLGSIIGGIAARFGSNPFVQAIAAIPRKVLDLIIAKVKSGIQSLTANPPGTGVQRWAPTVMRALGIAGLPQTLAYQSAWLKQIATESGGNPHAVQGAIGDINNITGDLAKGLVQVIGATFAAYRDPRLPNDRFNALSNLVAGMRYAAARYGVSGMLGVIGHGHGYDDGGMLPPGITAAINKTGRPERVLTDAQWRALAQRGGDTYHIALRVDAHDLSDLDDVRDLIDMLKRAPAVSRQTRRSGTVTVG